jgi:hypothetical protein
VPVRDAVQFLVDEREKLVERLAASVAPCDEQLRQLLWRGSWHCVSPNPTGAVVAWPRGRTGAHCSTIGAKSFHEKKFSDGGGFRRALTRK